MGINILPNLTGELTSPSPLPSSRGANSRESGQRDYSSLLSFPLPPCCLSTPPIHSHLTRWSTINGNRILSSTIAVLSFLPKSRSQTPRLQNIITLAWFLVPAYTSTEQRWHGLKNTTEGEPVAEGLPEAANVNAIGDSRQNDRDGSTLTTASSLRVISSRRSIPGKIWMPTNQIKSRSACAHASRELRTHALQASRGI